MEGCKEMLTSIVKRDGRKVPFELDKITVAVYKAAQAIGCLLYTSQIRPRNIFRTLAHCNLNAEAAHQLEDIGLIVVRTGDKIAL